MSMSTYQIHFKANPALWPSDPKENLAVWEKATAGGEAMVASGAMHDLCLVTASEGYCRVTADSATAALSICATFFPMFTQEIQELVPWNIAKDTVLKAVRQAAE